MALESLRGVVREASRGLVQRESIVELVVLAAIAREHVLVVGPPGTAKSEAVRRVARALGGSYFEYLLGRFTEPSEIFGPVDLRRLREGAVETETRGMLPEAEIAFLDEVFLGSTAILNTLLGLLNERVFRRGHTQIACPLRVCVGASNALPDEPSLAAFADRFLVHAFVEPIADPHLEELLESGWSLESSSLSEDRARLDALAEAEAGARRMDLAGVRGALAEAVRALRQAGIELSDRRAVKVQRLVAAAAALDGRAVATEGDLWPIVFAVPDAAGQRRARDRLRPLLERSRNETLVAAVEEASLGPLARARRIVERGRELIASPPTGDDERRRWRLRLEGVAREIDAGFAVEAMPDDVATLRREIVDIVQHGS